MSKVIDIDAVYAAIETACEEIEASAFRDIVFCNDCKYLDTGETVEAKFTGRWCALHERSVEGDDYCSWGTA